MTAPPTAKGFSSLPSHRPDAESPVVPYDAATFFDGFYRHKRAGALTDRDTLGPLLSELDAHFHFNAVENAILKALARVEPIPPRSGMIQAWEHALRREGRRLFDVGSGAGHWIEFFARIGRASEAVGCEIAPRALEHLHARFDPIEGVTILDHDIAEAAPPAELVGQGFDYVTAIGVMFHIVDDARWAAAVNHIASVLKPGGLALIGGEFGDTTRNVQHHADDAKPLRDAAPADGVFRVSKRVRSLSDWRRVADAAGLEVVDLIRSDADPGFVTPENDLLVLRRPAA